jgi:hypothetical protein
MQENIAKLTTALVNMNTTNEDLRTMLEKAEKRSTVLESNIYNVLQMQRR